MSRDHDAVLRRIEERLTTASRWIAARGASGGRDLERLRERLGAARAELRREATRSAADALARARATVADLERDAGAPPDPALRRDEVEALERHLDVAALLLPRVSDLDDPSWRSAYAAYERSWDELESVFAGGAGGAPEVGRR